MAAAGGRIVQLDPTVVNRIAAGEVIQRPSSALKELIENSLDAGAAQVSVVAKAGGLAMLQISDNGCGIDKADFPLVCERFATSKLCKFEDLLSIRTYGFRGEALASISHVARVTITSMTPGAQCAFKASFSDGKLVAAPKPSAGMRGTVIQVEDMFYNVPARKAAFKNTSEEYNRILDVVTRYALHHGPRGVAFTCKNASDTVPDLNMPAGTSLLDAIANVYGTSLKKELLPLAVSAGSGAATSGPSSSSSSSSSSAPAPAAAAAAAAASSSAAMEDEDSLAFTCRGYVSNANYSMKRGVFTLFINARLVDCSPLKRALEVVYAEYLPKGAHPFIHLAIDMPPDHVDVNVHPTKREVNFLHQEALVEAVVAGLQAVLKGANASRSFATQTLLPLAPLTPAGDAFVTAASMVGSNATTSAKRASALLSTPSAGGGGSGRTGAGSSSGSGGAVGEDDDFDVAAAAKVTAALSKAYGAAVSASPLAATAAEIAASDIQPAAKLRRRGESGGGGDKSTASAAAAAAEGEGEDQEVLTETVNASAQKRTGIDGFRAASRGSAAAAASGSSSAPPSARAPQKTVRVDASFGAMDAFVTRQAAVPAATASQRGGAGSSTIVLDGSDGSEDEEGAAATVAEIELEGTNGTEGTADDADQPASAEALHASRSAKRARAAMKPVQLTSVQELLGSVAAEQHDGLAAMLKRHVFVGVVDRHLSLVQYNTRLLLVNHTQLARELFYQQCLRLFENARSFALRPAPCVQDIAALALTAAGVTNPAEVADTAAGVAALLLEKAAMLSEYFSIRFEAEPSGSDVEGSSGSRVLLTHLPRLADGHAPQLLYLPDFIMTLALDVDWTQEKECFHGVAQVIAALYAQLPPIPTHVLAAQGVLGGTAAAAEEAATAIATIEAGNGDGSSGSGSAAAAAASVEAYRRDPASVHWQVAQVLFPAFRNLLTPPRKLVRDHHVVQVASTEQLYRIFERC